MHRCAAPRLMDFVGAAARLDLLSAVASATGLRVNCALMASARYSRLRVTPMRQQPGDERREDPADDPQHEEHDDQRVRRRRSSRARRAAAPTRAAAAAEHPRPAPSESSVTAPTSAAIIVIRRTSRFWMCPISWPTTACSSSRLSGREQPLGDRDGESASVRARGEGVRVRIVHDADCAASGARRRSPSPRPRSPAASPPASAARDLPRARGPEHALRTAAPRVPRHPRAMTVTTIPIQGTVVIRLRRRVLRRKVRDRSRRRSRARRRTARSQHQPRRSGGGSCLLREEVRRLAHACGFGREIHLRHGALRLPR